jgi:hypothetical protein
MYYGGILDMPVKQTVACNRTCDDGFPSLIAPLAFESNCCSSRVAEPPKSYRGTNVNACARVCMYKF